MRGEDDERLNVYIDATYHGLCSREISREGGTMIDDDPGRIYPAPEAPGGSTQIWQSDLRRLFDMLSFGGAVRKHLRRPFLSGEIPATSTLGQCFLLVPSPNTQGRNIVSSFPPSFVIQETLSTRAQPRSTLAGVGLKPKSGIPN